MIFKQAIDNQKSENNNWIRPRSHWRAAVIALICLVTVYVLCYGPILRKVGFYLDDWSMWCYLQFGPKEFLSSVMHCLKDDKVIIRPLEAPYFTALYLLFGTNPLGHHIINAIFEVMGAWFLCLILARWTDNMALSVVASILFLLNPIHDATHYWITASSVTVSLSLFLCSFWLCLKGEQQEKPGWIIASVPVFALSVFNYESFAPLSLLTIVTVFLQKAFRSSLLPALKHALLIALPFLSIVITMWFYKTQLLPLLNIGYVIPVSISLTHFSEVIKEGFRMAMSPCTLTFLYDRAREGFSFLQQNDILRLIGISLVVIIASALAIRKQTQDRKLCEPPKHSSTLLSPSNDEQHLASNSSITSHSQVGLFRQAPVQALALIGLGFFTVLVAYSIFAVAPGYMPQLNSIWNRLNTGASVGIALISMGMLTYLTHILRRFPRLIRASAMTVAVLPVVLFFTLADWGYSRPWVVSWKMQKHIQQIIRSAAGDFKSGDSILLANTPRYVMWSPLFDGVWDFQSMVRLSLHNKQIKAGVVSERIIVTPTYVKDVSRGYVCGVYPYSRMRLLFPCPEEWIPTKSAETFIDTVERKGMGFGLDPQMPSKWRQQLINGPKS